MKSTPKTHPVSFRLVAGTYWITDPCYVYSPSEWDLLVEKIVKSGNPNICEYPGGNVYIWSTAYGDGIYELKGPIEGDLYVDSGTLAIVPDALVRKWKLTTIKELKKLAVKITTASDFNIIETGEGDVEFGFYSVNTSGSDMPDDWDED